MTTLIEQLMTKLDLHEPILLEKTKEFVRLLELRSANVPLQVNEYGKIVLCADLAATALGSSVDKETAQKLSGLRKTQYANNKRMFEKLLDLNKIVDVNDICIKLNLTGVAPKAHELLTLFQKEVSNRSTDIDVSHPQYAAMAVFYACKLQNQKAPKSKILPFSNIRPTQWLQLEQRFSKLVDSYYKDGKSNKCNKENSTVTQSQENQMPKNAIKVQKSEVEDYESWKKRMLMLAESNLKKDLQNSRTENESIILGI